LHLIQASVTVCVMLNRFQLYAKKVILLGFPDKAA